MNIIEGAGLFIYPLGLCSVLTLFILIERLIALRTRRVIPIPISKKLAKGQLPQWDDEPASVAGKIIHFYQENEPDPESLKAFSKNEVSRMERGLFILDIIVGAAPLLGLLGTVMGLIQVFSHISAETGMPEPGAFIQGIALALTTTMLGLAIAIPALVGNSYLGRKIEVLSSKLEILLEHLLSLSTDSDESSD